MSGGGTRMWPSPQLTSNATAVLVLLIVALMARGSILAIQAFYFSRNTNFGEHLSNSVGKQNPKLLIVDEGVFALSRDKTARRVPYELWGGLLCET